MRRYQNWLAGVIAALVILGMPAVMYAYQRHFTEGVVTIHAHQWGYTPDLIQVPAGQPVHLRLVSDDVIHGFTLSELGVEVPELYPGHPVDVQLEPLKPGRYLFNCMTYCGLDHAKMLGYLEVK